MLTSIIPNLIGKIDKFSGLSGPNEITLQNFITQVEALSSLYQFDDNVKAKFVILHCTKSAADVITSQPELLNASYDSVITVLKKRFTPIIDEIDSYGYLLSFKQGDLSLYDFAMQLTKAYNHISDCCPMLKPSNIREEFLTNIFIKGVYNKLAVHLLGKSFDSFADCINQAQDFDKLLNKEDDTNSSDQIMQPNAGQPLEIDYMSQNSCNSQTNFTSSPSNSQITEQPFNYEPIYSVNPSYDNCQLDNVTHNHTSNISNKEIMCNNNDESMYDSFNNNGMCKQIDHNNVADQFFPQSCVVNNINDAIHNPSIMQPIINLPVNTVNLTCLLDSAASRNLIKFECLKYLNVPMYYSYVNLKCTNGSKLHIAGVVDLEFLIDGQIIKESVFVVKNAQFHSDILIGISLLSKFPEVKMNFNSNGSVTIGKVNYPFVNFNYLNKASQAQIPINKFESNLFAQYQGTPLIGYLNNFEESFALQIISHLSHPMFDASFEATCPYNYHSNGNNSCNFCQFIDPLVAKAEVIALQLKAASLFQNSEPDVVTIQDLPQCNIVNSEYSQSAEAEHSATSLLYKTGAIPKVRSNDTNIHHNKKRLLPSPGLYTDAPPLVTAEVDVSPHTLIAEQFIQDHNVSMAQLIDEECRPVLKYLKEHNPVDFNPQIKYDKFKIIDNCLYFNNKGESYKLLIPMALRHKAFNYIHYCSSSSSCISHIQTKKQLQEFFYWPNMTKEVSTLYKSCPFCNQLNVN
ncbi:unnamed protein product [Rotaria socialis]|uniref:Integrase zinc-binding domain-containing protein n=1 Tax=Rotaria socialis TaxID=392032 RepID=A0A818I4G8_9BILA|nr:unnamed protein product [Rotaria socialis]CAF4885864.1 unnamed protein product [Rotaria socialis]